MSQIPANFPKSFQYQLSTLSESKTSLLARKLWVKTSLCMEIELELFILHKLLCLTRWKEDVRCLEWKGSECKKIASKRHIHNCMQIIKLRSGNKKAKSTLLFWIETRLNGTGNRNQLTAFAIFREKFSCKQRRRLFISESAWSNSIWLLPSRGYCNSPNSVKVLLSLARLANN